MQIPINIISSNKIDAVKWNACVAANDTGLIYAQYSYLNTICTNWAGIVIGNYQAIMPIPWRKKMGIKYFYVPAFIQQLGFIGNTAGLTPNEIFQLIQSVAKTGDLLFNYKNEWIISNHYYHKKNNFTIPLSQDYQSIASKYSKDLIKNLHKAAKANCQYLHDTDISTAIALFQLQYGNRFKHITPLDFKKFEQLCLLFQQNQQCLIRIIKDSTSEKTLATALLLKDNKRLYLVMNSTTIDGRKLSANHLLIDQLLKEFSNQSIIFDFEGSNLDGVKTFYENFHPENQPYFHYTAGLLTSVKHFIKQFTN